MHVSFIMLCQKIYFWHCFANHAHIRYELFTNGHFIFCSFPFGWAYISRSFVEYEVKKNTAKQIHTLDWISVFGMTFNDSLLMNDLNLFFCYSISLEFFGTYIRIFFSVPSNLQIVGFEADQFHLNGRAKCYISNLFAVYYSVTTKSTDCCESAEASEIKNQK